MGRAASTKLPAVREARDADLPRGPDDPELQPLLVVVVYAVLRVDDPDVHVEGSRQELKLADREADHSFRLHRHGDAVDERVRPEHADAVVAIEVHPKDRVAHALGISITDLDRG